MKTNLETEQALLNCILINPDVGNKYIPLLHDYDFELSQDRIVFNAMNMLYQNNKPVDFIIVLDKLTQTKKLSNAGGATYLAKLLNITPSTVNVNEYYMIVKRNSILRQIIKAGGQITRFAHKSQSISDSIDFMDKLIAEIKKEANKV